MTLDPWVERFRGNCAGLGVTPLPGAPLALAVSGGPDSMAMLALAAAAFPGAVVAATVDHQLRPGSAQEAAMVAAHCAMQGMAHSIHYPAAPLAGASIQAVARTARYALLAAWARGQGAQALATAHHADDQAETFLMRAARGSGPGGLGGIRPRMLHAGVAVVRPLLGWRRAELRAIAEDRALPFVDDPSNVDPRYDRTRVRALLANAPWLDPLQLAAAADHAREADAALDMLADAHWSRVDHEQGACHIDMAGLPRELVRRLARRAIDAIRVTTGITRPAFDAYAANIEPLLDTVAAGKRATHAGILVSRRAATWHFRVAPPRRSH